MWLLKLMWLSSYHCTKACLRSYGRRGPWVRNPVNDMHSVADNGSSRRDAFDEMIADCAWLPVVVFTAASSYSRPEVVCPLRLWTWPSLSPVLTAQRAFLVSSAQILFLERHEVWKRNAFATGTERSCSAQNAVARKKKTNDRNWYGSERKVVRLN